MAAVMESQAENSTPAVPSQDDGMRLEDASEPDKDEELAMAPMDTQPALVQRMLSVISHVAPPWTEIRIVIRVPGGKKVELPVTRGVPMETVFDTACEELGYHDRSKVYFTFHGKVVLPTDTPEGLSMGEGAVVNVGLGKPPTAALKTAETSVAEIVAPPVLDLEWRCDACGAVSATSTAQIEESPEMQCFRCGLKGCPRDVWSRSVTMPKAHDAKDDMGLTQSSDALAADFVGQRVRAPVGGMMALVTQEQRQRLLKAAVIYLFFCVHFLVISMMQRPVSSMFEVQNALQQELVSQVIPGTEGLTFLNISSWDGFWQWTDGVLMHKVYDTTYWPDSSGGAARAPYSMLTVAKYNRVLSAIRFRQVRVKPTLPRCPRNSGGLLPTQFEMACLRPDDYNVEDSCDTPLESHSLSRPCWGVWNADHQESVYPGKFEMATSKVTMSPYKPEWNMLCHNNCDAYYLQGLRTADQLSALSIPGVADFLISFDRFVSSVTAFEKCKEGCDVSGSSYAQELSAFDGKGSAPNFCGSHGQGCSGDVVDLPLNSSEALRRVAAMKRERWTSESTRGVSVELNFYNPNLDIAAVLRLTVDANPGGLLEPHFFVRSCRLTVTGNTADTVRFVLEILFACWCLYYFLIEVSEMNYSKWEYFLDVWNYLELSNLGGFVYGLVVWWMYVAGHDFDSFRKRDPDSFKDLYPAAEEFTNGAFNACFCIMCMCLRWFKYIRLSTRFGMFWRTITEALQIIGPLVIVYMGFILVFTLSGHWLFGQQVRIFSSLSSAMLHLVLSIKDGINYAEIKETSPIAAFVWYFAWYITAKIVVIGFIIAILIVVFGEMLHQFQVLNRAGVEAEEQGAKIPRLIDYVLQDSIPAALLPEHLASKESLEYHSELKETLQEVDLDALWERGMEGLLDNETALDAAELTFLFEEGKGQTPDQSARHFINRLCVLASLSHVEEPKTVDLLEEVKDLEAKFEKIGSHIHGSRRGLEHQFPKLRPYITSAQTQASKLLRDKSMVDTAVPEESRQIRYVFKDSMQIDLTHYLVEMSTVGKELHVSAYDSDAEKTLDLTVKAREYQRLLADAAHDHSNLAKRLQHKAGSAQKLEFGPPKEPNSPRQAVQRVRAGNAVFPGEEGKVKPPLRGQLKMAAAVLDAQKKGDPGNLGQVKGRAVVESFLRTAPTQRAD